MLRAPHPDGKQDRCHDPDREGDIAARITPGPLLAVDGAEGQSTHRKGDDRGSDPVEVRRRIVVATLRHVLPGRPGGDGNERNVDEKRGAPGDGVDEEAAHQWSEDRRRSRSARPRPESASLLLAREVRGEQRKRAGNEQRSCGTLEDAEQDEQLHARCKAAEHRGRSETDQTDQEGPLPAVEVVDGAGQDEQRAERQQVRVVDIRLALEHAEERARQVASDPGQRDVDHGRVEEHNPRAEDCRCQDPALGRHRLLQGMNSRDPAPILGEVNVRPRCAPAGSGSKVFATKEVLDDVWPRCLVQGDPVPGW